MGLVGAVNSLSVTGQLSDVSVAGIYPALKTY